MKQYELPVTQPVFRLKGGTLAATVLELSSIAPEALARQLAAKVAQAPQLLRQSPVILALDKLGDADGPLDLAGLLATCRGNELQPVAVRATRPDDIVQAAALGIAVLPPARGRDRALEAVADATADAGGADIAAPVASASADAAALAAAAGTAAAPGAATASVPAASAMSRPSRVITQPVRGGQQVYAEGDLILLAPVSAGAEVMADGNIHCYAALRGRALAGVQGDAGARLFCRELAAELVAIAGHYRVADDLKADALWGKAVQLSLRDDQLLLAPL